MNTGFLGPTVATVPTVYGIETSHYFNKHLFHFTSLQQYLPFTVLKHRPISWNIRVPALEHRLQQYLPFTVLKL